MMHGHYLYRLNLRANGSSILRHNDDIAEAVENRNKNSRAYNWAGSWRRSKIETADIAVLDCIKKNLHYNEPGPRVIDNDQIKIRIEDPYLQFYATSEEPLINLANKLLLGDNNHFVSVMMPASDEHEKLLSDGFVLRKTKVKWSHRIVLRDGRYSLETKQKIQNYLTSLGDEIKAPENFWTQLNKGGYIFGGYIYVNDPGLALMLNLINGKLVSKVEEFKMVPRT